MYNLSIFLYTAAIRLASIWNPKARLWVSGRQGWQARSLQALAAAGDRQRVWIHCASLGEFEQGRPVLEEIRRCYPASYIILSFFSPSGFEIRRTYPQADFICYLPADTAANARNFLDIVQPNLAIFIKYEYWLNYLEEMGRRKIPVLMVSAIFRPDQVFFRWYGGRWKRILEKIRMFFVQDEHSTTLLKDAGVAHFIRSGDTRFDRVIAVRNHFQPIDPVNTFCGDAPVVVAGSTWEEDEAIWDHYAHTHPEVKFIIAPHEVHEGHLRSISKRFQNSIRYTDLLKNGNSTDAHVLVIDSIGLLSRLYHYADICYVGGGFGGGIHNILEATVYGKPVIFGPEHDKFREAMELLDEGAAFTISSAPELERTAAMLMNDQALRQRAGATAMKYVQDNAGATKKVMDYIQENRLLTS